MSSINHNLKLLYDRSAKEWVEGLPLGNGRLGSMVLGGVSKERIQLNEDTLWTGIPKKGGNCGSLLNDLEKARKLIFDEQYVEGQNLINERLLGPWNESYAPMGNLYLDFKEERKYEDYRRELNLEDATVRIRYKVDNVEYMRTIFISKPDNIIVIKLEASKDGKLTFDAYLDSLLRFNTSSINERSILLNGKAPIHALPSYENGENPIIYDEDGKEGMNFQVLLDAQSYGGDVSTDGGVLRIENANSFGVVNEVKKSTEVVAEIAIASEEQAKSIEKMNDDIQKISDIVQSNSATAEESVATSEELMAQADVLITMLQHFSLKTS